MNEIIKVSDRAIGSGEVQTVNARDLHAFLGCGEEFAHWIKQRIEQYGFVENQDFASYRENAQKGRPRIEYAVSLDMAKELSMVERNAKGKEARLYFLECERRAKANVVDAAGLLSDPSKLRAALLSYVDENIALKGQVQVLAPKAAFHDAVVAATNAQTVQEVAKVLNMGPNRLFAFLRDEEMLMSGNLPYQQHIDAGHFRVVEKQFTRNGETQTYTQTLITGKGLALIQKRINKNVILRAVQPMRGFQLAS